MAEQVAAADDAALLEKLLWTSKDEADCETWRSAKIKAWEAGEKIKEKWDQGRVLDPADATERFPYQAWLGEVPSQARKGCFISGERQGPGAGLGNCRSGGSGDWINHGPGAPAITLGICSGSMTFNDGLGVLQKDVNPGFRGVGSVGFKNLSRGCPKGY